MRGPDRPIEAARVTPNGGVRIDAARLVAPAASRDERGPTPAATITPASAGTLPGHRPHPAGRPKAPPILFQVNLPTRWNGRSVQYGGGGFNGTDQRSSRWCRPALRRTGAAGQGYGPRAPTLATRTAPASRRRPSRSTTRLLNFAHASYKKVRDVSVELMRRAYGRAPQKMYFVGSSEGGREGPHHGAALSRRVRRHLQPRAGDPLDRAAACRPARQPSAGDARIRPRR